MTTPAMMGITKPTRRQPLGGWKENTYYICDVAFSASNVVHRAIFFTGFLNGREGRPGGYNGFVEAAGYEDGAPKYHEAYYIYPVIELMDRNMRVVNQKVQVDGGGA